jgi:hypothetical protein
MPEKFYRCTQWNPGGANQFIKLFIVLRKNETRRALNHNPRKRTQNRTWIPILKNSQTFKKRRTKNIAIKKKERRKNLSGLRDRKKVAEELADSLEFAHSTIAIKRGGLSGNLRNLLVGERARENPTFRPSCGVEREQAGEGKRGTARER